jgi:putative transcriptional regulator
MGERKVKIADVCRDTGLHRNTVTALYYERASRVDLKVIDILCKHFKCKVVDLFEYQPEDDSQ